MSQEILDNQGPVQNWKKKNPKNLACAMFTEESPSSNQRPPPSTAYSLPLPFHTSRGIPPRMSLEVPYVLQNIHLFL